MRPQIAFYDKETERFPGRPSGYRCATEQKQRRTAAVQSASAKYVRRSTSFNTSMQLKFY